MLFERSWFLFRVVSLLATLVSVGVTAVGAMTSAATSPVSVVRSAPASSIARSAPSSPVAGSLSSVTVAGGMPLVVRARRASVSRSAATGATAGSA